MALFQKLFANSTRADRATDAAFAPATDLAGEMPDRPGSTDTCAQVVAEAQACVSAGDFSRALPLIGRALEAAPDRPELTFARASTLFAWGRYREALVWYLRAESEGMHETSLFLPVGWTRYHTGNQADAEAWMRKAVSAEPNSWEAHRSLASVLQSLRRFDDAVAEFECALELQRDDVDCLIGLATCKFFQRQFANAELHFRRVLELAEGHVAAWDGLGAALSAQDRYVETFEALATAHRLASITNEEAATFVNYAVELRDSGRVHDALAVYERNLAQIPKLDGHYAYALALLAAGRLVEGWDQLEFRWLNEPLLLRRPGVNRPVWQGQDLRGKTILLREEQGLGDTIQFIRYATFVKEMGATVLMQVRAGLEEFARSFPSVDTAIGPDRAFPNFDFYIQLLSLPRVFGTDLATIPRQTPYLTADAGRIERWSSRISSQQVLKVGLAWAGDPSHLRDRYRSISLRKLAPLGDVSGVKFFSLQKGDAADEVRESRLPLVNLGPELKDLCDTAAVISQLDLVICVDTVVAHLAGALGKPVWLLLPRPADWRWLEEREDSPWYPTMRLFRQSRRGEWADVIEKVKDALVERVGLVTKGFVADPLPSVEQVAQPVSLPLARLSPGHRPGFSAVAETRVGIVQYFPDEPIVGDAISWYGEYLQPQLDLLARLIKPGATLMEVGAGVGVHALYLSAAMGPAGHLFLYEPRSVMQRVLRQNLAANRVGNVTLMRRALGRLTEAGWWPEAGASAATDSTPESVTSTPTETLDELQLEQLHLLKINGDVHALDVIKGAADTLWRLRPLLFIGARDEAALTELVSRAKDFGYRCWRMEAALFDPDNFNRRYDDIFSGKKALALLAIPEEITADIQFDRCVELA